MSETHVNLAIRQTVIAGGAAGAHTVTGIKTRDVLKSVVHLEVGAAVGVDGAEDLTDEFTISDTDEIDNTGGTDTSDGFLVIMYIAAHAGGGDLNRS